jgi:hypothetical protein
MKTSLIDIIRTERFLRDELADDDRLVFNARLLVDQELRRNLFFQRWVYRLVELYHRRKLKAQMHGVHERLVNDPARAWFSESIIRQFNP